MTLIYGQTGPLRYYRETKVEQWYSGGLPQVSLCWPELTVYWLPTQSHAHSTKGLRPKGSRFGMCWQSHFPPFILLAPHRKVLSHAWSTEIVEIEHSSSSSNTAVEININTHDSQVDTGVIYRGLPQGVSWDLPIHWTWMKITIIKYEKGMNPNGSTRYRYQHRSFNH